MKAGRLKKAGAGALAAAIALVGSWEGLRLNAYRDIVGVATVCYGETRGVSMDDVFTREECDSKLARRLYEFDAEISACLTREDEIPDLSYVAMLSLSYNIGSANFCRSTVARRANAGDVEGACNAIPMWNRAGGRVVRGLVNRREAERALCLEGLAPAPIMDEAA